jgi:hypothetical protein
LLEQVEHHPFERLPRRKLAVEIEIAVTHQQSQRVGHASRSGRRYLAEVGGEMR